MADESRLSLARTHSPVLTSFPWISGALVARADLRTLATSDHCSSGFLNHLRNFELNSVLQATSVEGKHYRHLLRLEYTEDAHPELRAKADRNRNPVEWSELCSVIAAYRLADVIALMETEPNIPPVYMERRTKAGPARPLPSFVRLADWTKPLMKFKVLIQTKSELNPLLAVENVQIKLLKSVFQCSQDSDKNRIASNIFAASLHLSYLLNNQFGAQELPELTKSLQDLTKIRTSLPEADHQSLESLKLTPAEILFWKETLSNEESSASSRGSSCFERQPLQVALIISPLYLLVPTRMLHNSFGKENILHTAIALGNQRPHILISVEKIIWRLLFGLAVGKVEPGEALNALVELIPWSDLESCSQEERQWFKLADTKARATKPNSRQPEAISKPFTSVLWHGQGQSGLQQQIGHRDQGMDIALTCQSPLIPIGSSSMPAMTTPPSDQRDSALATVSSSPAPPSSLLKASCFPTLRAATGVLGEISAPFTPTSSAINRTLSTTPPLSSGFGVLSGSRSSVGSEDHMDLRLDGEENPPVTPVGSSVQHAPLSSSQLPAKPVGARKVVYSAKHVEDSQVEVAADDEQTSSIPSQTTVSVPMLALEELAQGAALGLGAWNEEAGEQEMTGRRHVQDAEGGVNMEETSELGGVKSRTRRSARQQGSGELRTKSINSKGQVAAAFGSSRPYKRKRMTSDSLDDVRLKQRKLETSSHTAVVGQGTKDDPIRVEEYCLLAVKGFERATSGESTLQPLLSSPGRRYTVKDPFVIYDGQPHPEKHEIWPSVHDKQELIKLVQLVRSTRSSNVESIPLHVAEPKRSLFRTFAFAEYSKLKHKDVESILKTHCIVVTGMPWADMAFDKDGLRTLAPLDAIVPIQDLSQAYPENNLSDRVMQGTVEQMLLSAKTSGAGDRRKALNGLSFPFDVAEQEQTSFAACRVAWSNTSRTVFTLDTKMPVSHINWGLGATEGASTFWHVDSDGLSTTVDVKTGSKIWIVGSDDPSKFSRLGFLLSNGFELDQAPLDFKTEAILLTAKTRLIMRPGVVHAVYTPQDTICHGTHFYSTGSMQATLVSLIHGFVCHRYITNISHPETRVLLRRLMHFYHRGLVQRIPLTDAELAHVPQIAVPQGETAPNDEVLNFLSACVLAFFANVLDPRTYTAPGTTDDDRNSDSEQHLVPTCDANSIPLAEREEICETRGACMDAFAWFRTCFEVRRAGEQEPVDVVSTYLVQLARSILRYKHAAEINGISAAGGCRLTDLERQLENAMRLDQLSWDCWVSLHQGQWLDEEMSIKDNVDIGVGGQETSAQGGDDHHGDVRAEGLCINVVDDQVQPSRSHPNVRWRDETLLLDQHNLYHFKRNGKLYPQSTGKWMDLGSTAFDSEFRQAVSSWRARVEARSVRLRLEAKDFTL